ncbi:hypothetical protein A2U01_0077114, partial [Trifolium medium]|nr:hypothetical protein [Trifolium medium]
MAANSEQRWGKERGGNDDMRTATTEVETMITGTLFLFFFGIP